MSSSNLRGHQDDPHEPPDIDGRERGQNPHINLVIRATNGLPWPTDKFKGKDTVEEVVRKALQHFVKEGAMTEGAYDLVLVADGAAGEPLHPGDRLEDIGVEDGAVL